jgi:hypothetical protein
MRVTLLSVFFVFLALPGSASTFTATYIPNAAEMALERAYWHPMAELPLTYRAAMVECTGHRAAR